MNKIQVPKEWLDIYQCLESNDINNINLIYNTHIKNNPIINTDIYFYPILSTAAECGHIETLDWLSNIEIFNIDSFQLFLIAAEWGQIDVIKWGILKGYEFMNQHVLHAVKHGKLEVLEFAVDNVEDSFIFYNELFIKTAVTYDHDNIIQWYINQGIPIDANSYKCE